MSRTQSKATSLISILIFIIATVLIAKALKRGKTVATRPSIPSSSSAEQLKTMGQNAGY